VTSVLFHENLDLITVTFTVTETNVG